METATTVLFLFDVIMLESALMFVFGYFTFTLQVQRWF
jgi:hypothetical protein